MPEIHEVATDLRVRSRCQVHPAGAGRGHRGKVAFDLRGGEVVVTRADAEHEDPPSPRS